MAKIPTTSQEVRARRKARSRAKMTGTSARPRLSVYRSLRGLFAQLIDDEAKKTVVSASVRDAATDSDVGARIGKVAEAYRVGWALAKKAQEKKITTIVFDRSGYAYHGRVAALADGARDAGLVF